jgi:hypothetical protein
MIDGLLERNDLRAWRIAALAAIGLAMLAFGSFALFAFAMGCFAGELMAPRTRPHASDVTATTSNPTRD